MDIKNNSLILSPLLDRFGRDRLNGHKKLFKESNIDTYTFENDKYAINYKDVEIWCKDDPFWKKIKNRNKKIAYSISTTARLLTKELLPAINFNPKHLPIIKDNYNAIVHYILASWNLAHFLRSAGIQSSESLKTCIYNNSCYLFNFISHNLSSRLVNYSTIRTG